MSSTIMESGVLLVEEGGFSAVADFEVEVEDFPLESAEALAVGARVFERRLVLPC